MKAKRLNETIQVLWYELAYWLSNGWVTAQVWAHDLTDHVFWKLEEWLMPDREFNPEDYDQEPYFGPKGDE